MASITLMFGADTVGTYNITCHPFVLGRDLTCELTIDNVGVSREHCRFLWDGKHFFVEDMDSANGTYHRGHKIRKTSVGDGDRIQIAKYTLVFNRTPGEPPPVPKGGEPEPEPAGPVRSTEKSAASDNLLTFKMDARQLETRMEKIAPGISGPKRAADVASSFGDAPSQPATVRTRRRGSFLGGVVKLLAVMALLAVVGAAVLMALKSLGIIGG